MTVESIKAQALGECQILNYFLTLASNPNSPETELKNRNLDEMIDSFLAEVLSLNPLAGYMMEFKVGELSNVVLQFGLVDPDSVLSKNFREIVINTIRITMIMGVEIARFDANIVDYFVPDVWDIWKTKLLPDPLCTDEIGKTGVRTIMFSGMQLVYRSNS